MKFKSDNPYPKIIINEKNSYYARVLYENYAASVSEDTAIHLYLYQALIIDDEALKNALLEISKVEMIHLRLLGEMIEKLGSLPIYGSAGIDGCFRLWTASNVYYGTTLKEMLEEDIKDESMAIANYQKSSQKIDDENIQSVLKRIIEDEELHLAFFKKVYENASK